MRDMPPYQPSPLKNETTGEIIPITNHRLTRCQMHRLLKAHGIQHHHSAPLRELINLAYSYGLSIEALPPGDIPDLKAKAPPEPKPAPKQAARAPMIADAGEYADDGYPKNHGYLKKMCKERGIKTKNTDKRPELVKRLNDYMQGIKE